MFFILNKYFLEFFIVGMMDDIGYVENVVFWVLVDVDVRFESVRDGKV